MGAASKPMLWLGVLLLLLAVCCVGPVHAIAPTIFSVDERQESDIFSAFTLDQLPSRERLQFLAILDPSAFPCANQTSCKGCRNQLDLNSVPCFWCGIEDDGMCASVSNLNMVNCTNGWCTGDSCEHVCKTPCEVAAGIWPCSPDWFGQLVLMFFYGVLLAQGAKLISDGSELLLEILDPGLIGGLLLPILGAVPDAAIIVVAGALGARPDAITQVAVGVGTLAGSTVMLLTVPWAGSMFLARTDIKHGEALESVCTIPLKDVKRAFTQSGVSMDQDTAIGARIMLVTASSYLIMQGVAFYYLAHDESSESSQQQYDHDAHGERWFALTGGIVCALFLVAYCVYQVMSPRLQQQKIDMARKIHVQRRALLALKKRALAVTGTDSLAFLPTDGSGTADDGSDAETHGEKTLLLAADSESSDDDVDIRDVGLAWRSAAQQIQANETEGDDDDDDDDDIGDMSPREIAIRAAIQLTVGTLVVSIFSDPMVEVITMFGETVNVPSFYISFIVTPFCSNASELISSLMFAAKKRRKNTTLTYSALYGAATMNNTLCLGIFCFLIFARKLAWVYSAETMSILFVTLCVGIPASFMTTFRLYWALIIITLYPLSLLLVYILENFAHW
eukprot:CAMPEP_0177646148 /NCGR_PEP_ID=MMETSP0447-20121125/9620_1 /TAXON_ID=0 /ORGANISM="Stygamoeba regulata, Strain BSH-02190019" /LENGTH=619 /DNA_ID=CAMNT_0019148663 /DNA_START=55 /DNA_END=1911 /DNA_ORIENTATION=-